MSIRDHDRATSQYLTGVTSTLAGGTDPHAPLYCRGQVKWIEEAASRAESDSLSSLLSPLPAGRL